MSHFTVLVIGENPEEQLQPFHEYECTGVKDQYVVFHSKPEEELRAEYENHKVGYATYEQFLQDWHGYKLDGGKWGRWTNPNAKWDWYVLGGRWTGYFKMKQLVYVVVGESGVMTPRAKMGYGDAALKGDIDFDGMRDEEAKKAQDHYDYAMFFLSKYPENDQWDTVRKRVADIKEARRIYWDQLRCKEWSRMRQHDDFPFGYHTSPDDFLVSREEYIQNARNSAISTHAVIKDGKWYERGQMGWWAIVSNEKTENDWNVEFSKLIDDLPDDTLLSVYDCHI